MIEVRASEELAVDEVNELKSTGRTSTSAYTVSEGTESQDAAPRFLETNLSVSDILAESNEQRMSLNRNSTSPRTPSFLHLLFGKYGGHVLYKHYPFERSDDSTAITHLREQTSHSGNVKFTLFPSAPPSDLEFGECERFENVARSFLKKYDRAAFSLYSSWLETIKFRNELETQGKKRSQGERCEAEDESGKMSTYREWVRQRYDVPDTGSVLVIGLPNSFLGYRTPKFASEEEQSDFRVLLNEAGFPNRFQVEGSEGYENGKVHCRQSRTCASIIPNDGPDVPDVDFGLIYVGRTRHGRLVGVIGGCTELATQGGVRLICDDHPLIDEAIGKFVEGKCSEIDIAYRCEKAGRPSDRERPGAPKVTTKIANHVPTGFTWGRLGESAYEELLHPPEKQSGEIGSCGHFRWTSDKQGTVTIHCEKAVKLGSRYLFPSKSTWKVFEKLDGVVETCAQRWFEKDRQAVAKWLGNKKRESAIEIGALGRLAILVMGETGTGKSFIAEYVAGAWGGTSLEASHASKIEHEQLETCEAELLDAVDAWRPGTGRALTVGSIPTMNDALAASKLFGAISGAATDISGGIGLLHQAGTGVLFLDEYFVNSDRLQEMQLTLLSTGTFQVVGLNRPSTFACPIVAATNLATSSRDLERLISDGKIREDIVPRFTHQCVLAPLRDRPGEIIPALISVFAHHAGQDVRGYTLSLTVDALEAIVTHGYPGNFRELERYGEKLFYETNSGSKAINTQHLKAVGLIDSESAPDGFKSPEDEGEDKDAKKSKKKGRKKANEEIHVKLEWGKVHDPSQLLVHLPIEYRMEPRQVWGVWIPDQVVKELFDRCKHAVPDEGSPTAEKSCRELLKDIAEQLATKGHREYDDKSLVGECSGLASRVEPMSFPLNEHVEFVRKTLESMIEEAPDLRFRVATTKHNKQRKIPSNSTPNWLRMAAIMLTGVYIAAP